MLSTAVLPRRDHVQKTMMGPLYRMDGVRSANLPTYGGETFDVEGWEACFLEGFREGYERMLPLRSDILDGLAAKSDMTVRSLYDSSKLHNALLGQLFRPECLASAEKQEAVLSRLRIGLENKEESCRESVFSYERDCLRRGEVPTYCVGIFSQDLCGEDARDVIAKDAFSLSPYAAVREKLLSLSDAERKMEEKLIHLSMNHRLCDDGRVYAEVLRESLAPASETVLRAELEELLERALDEAVETPDGTLCWHSSALVYMGWRHDCGLCTLQADMMTLGGVILGCFTERELRARVAALMDRCMEGVSDKLVCWQHSEAIPPLLAGTRSGMAGLLRGCAFAERAGSARAAETIDGLVSLLHDERPCDKEKLGLADGLAGLLLALSELPVRSDRSVEEVRLHEVARLADLLTSRLSDEEVANSLGREHNPFLGMAGIGAALAAAQRVLGPGEYEAQIQDAFRAVCACWDEKRNGWHTNNGFLSTVKGEYAAGIGLCALSSLEGAEDSSGSIRRCLELAIRAEMKETMLFRQDILENGNALRVLFLNRADKLFPGHGFRERAEGILAQMIERKSQVGDYVVSPLGLRNSFDPSLIFGTTGIGLALAECLALRSSASRRP